MTIAELKHSLDLTHPRRAGMRIPAELRQELASHIRAGRDKGMSWAALSEQTGLRGATLMRIGQEPRAAMAPALVPVLAGPSCGDAAELVLQLPSGAQLRGLNVQSAAALLRALG